MKLLAIDTHHKLTYQIELAATELYIVKTSLGFARIAIQDEDVFLAIFRCNRAWAAELRMFMAGIWENLKEAAAAHLPACKDEALPTARSEITCLRATNDSAIFALNKDVATTFVKVIDQIANGTDVYEWEFQTRFAYPRSQWRTFLHEMLEIVVTPPQDLVVNRS